VGNGLLKFAEGMAIMLMGMMREEMGRDWRGKLGAWIMRPNLRKLKRRLDYAEYGGAPLLGVNGICIIGHGSSKALGIYHAIRVAKEAVAGQAIAIIREELAAPAAPEAGTEGTPGPQDA
jgi:glycerol-3-phosphate acyltransferase PlsX